MNYIGSLIFEKIIEERPRTKYVSQIMQDAGFRTGSSKIWQMAGKNEGNICCEEIC